MQFWLIQTLNSVAFGGLLFLLASGFSLIFGLLRIPNLAHGGLFMLGAYLGATLLNQGLPLWAAALAAAGIVGALGAVIERVLLRRLAGNEQGQVLVTLGLAFIIADICLSVWGGDPMPLAAPPSLSRPLRLFGYAFPTYRLVVLVAAILALSLNILIGYCGMSSLGHAVYLGVPAYAYAWLMTNTAMGAALAAVLAVLCGTVLAAFFGLLALRAAGLSFMMITLALGQVVWGLSYRWVWLTGGDNGLRAARLGLPGVDLTQPTPFYYLVAVVFLVALTALWQLSRSPFAACLRGARDQPRRMRMFGHPVWLMQWAAFILAGFWGSVAGLLYIWDFGFISPQTMSLQQSAEVLLMVVLGGAGTLAGPIAGAGVITVIKTIVSSYVDRWSSLLGLIFIVSVLLMPRGLVPGVRRWFAMPVKAP